MQVLVVIPLNVLPKTHGKACDAVEWELGERTLCERLEKNLRTRSK